MASRNAQVGTLLTPAEASKLGSRLGPAYVPPPPREESPAAQASVAKVFVTETDETCDDDDDGDASAPTMQRAEPV